MARQGRKPGWYTDPAVPARFRFWDGQAWTRWLASTRRAPWPSERDGAPVAPVEDGADRLVAAVKWVALAVVVVVVAATAVGMALNRRDGANPVAWQVSGSAPPTVSPRGYSELEVNGSSVTLFEGGVSMALPTGWQVSEESEATGMFNEVVFAAKPKSAVGGGIDAFVGVGTVAGAPLVETREMKAASLARLAGTRLFREVKGVQYGEVETALDSTFGPEHPGATARMEVTWQGGSTVVVARIAMLDQARWFGWIGSQGPELTPELRAACDEAWKKTTVRDS